MPLLTTKGAASASGLGLTARSGEAPTYVEDVFSTYLYAGTSGTQAISNDIALGSTAAWKTRTLLDGTTSFIYKVRKDTAGNYIVLGNSIVSGIYRLLVIKFDSAWNILWQKRISQDGTSQTVTAEALALDPSNNIYVAFGIEGAAASLVKLNSSGDLQWARAIEPSSGSGRYLNTVLYNTVDGFLYVGGRTSGPGGPGLYAKYNTSGTVQWMYKYKPPGTYYGNQQYGHVKSMAHDSAGNVYMAGLEFDGGWKGIVVKINSSGTFQWNKRVSNTSSGIDSIFIDSSDGIYIGYYDSASFSGSGYASADVHTTKLNTSGAIVWDRKVVGYPDGPAIATVTGDSSGGIYTTLGKQVVKHNSSGTFQWSRRLYTGLFYGVSAIDSTLYATGSGTSNGFITELATDGSTTSGAAYHTISADVTDSAGSQTLSSGTSEVEAHTGAEQASTATVSTASTTATLYTQAEVVGKGGLVWVKGRNETFYHRLASSPGPTLPNYLSSNASDAAGTVNGTIPAFSANGFTVSAGGGGTNTSGYNYVSWTFRKQPKFFDIVTWTGDGTSNRVISHNLESTPGCILVKRIEGGFGEDWSVFHRSLTAGQNLVLNSTAASGSGSIGSATSTTFTISTAASGNSSGYPYVAYIFAHNAGGFGLSGAENIISCGSFTADNAGGGAYAGGATVNLGYEPQFVMFKETNSTLSDPNWIMVDTFRGYRAQETSGSDVGQQRLRANTSEAEANAGGCSFPTSTGFSALQLTGGATYIYIAIRRGPMKVPTSGTSVFSPVTYTGNGSTNTVTSNFPVDLSITKYKSSNGPKITVVDRLRGFGTAADATKYLFTSATDAEGGASNGVTDMGNTGLTLGAWSQTNFGSADYIDWMFQRAPSFFDEVCYTGTGVANTAFTHNLTVTPELMIVKPRSAATAPNWRVWSPINSTDFNLLQLSTDGAASSSLYSSSNVFPAIPTATTFTVGGSGSIQLNESGQTFVAYLFATCAGVSKVGSYTGTATTKQIDCGFTGGARFVLIKRTDSTGDWYVWDTARGIVSGNDPYLLLNSTAAEVTNTDYVDTYSAGFEISSTAPAAINASGGTYIFLAIA